MLKNFEVEKRHAMNKMTETYFILTKIGRYTNLGDPNSTIYTIFCNLRTRELWWNISFSDLRTSKISIYNIQISIFLSDLRNEENRQSLFHAQTLKWKNCFFTKLAYIGAEKLAKNRGLHICPSIPYVPPGLLCFRNFLQ